MGEVATLVSGHAGDTYRWVEKIGLTKWVLTDGRFGQLHAMQRWRQG